MALLTEQFLSFQGADQKAGPKYARLKQFLIGELVAGRMQSGEALPSVREMAESCQLARNTVRQALTEMQREGIVDCQQGRGSFLTDNAKDRVCGNPSENSTGSFVLMLTDPSGGVKSLLQKLENCCHTVNHNMILCDTRNEIDKQASQIFRLLHENVAGVAMIPVMSPPTPAYHVIEFQQRGVPVVLLEHEMVNARAPLVKFPAARMGRMAAKCLLEHGHRRATLFSATPCVGMYDAYKRGFRDTLRDGGGELPEHCIYEGKAGAWDLAGKEAEIFKTLKRIFTAEDRPTAIWAVQDDIAELIYLLLQRLGLRVPEDVSLLGVGDTHRQGAIAQRLSAVTYSNNEIGEHAFRLLWEMRSGKRPLDDGEEVVVTVELSDGQTLGPAPEI